MHWRLLQITGGLLEVYREDHNSFWGLLTVMHSNTEPSVTKVKIGSNVIVPPSVHGFERTVVLVDEGSSEETVLRMNIKGNALTENPRLIIDLFCYDVTTGE